MSDTPAPVFDAIRERAAGLLRHWADGASVTTSEAVLVVGALLRAYDALQAERAPAALVLEAADAWEASYDGTLPESSPAEEAATMMLLDAIASWRDAALEVQDG